MRTPAVYVIHGWSGYPEKNWFPWLKKELKNRDIDCFVPEMPNTNTPDLGEWIQKLHEMVEFNQPLIFVGHSLGVITALRYIEELPESTKVEGLISVCGFHNINLGIEEIETFVQDEIDFPKIRNQISHRYVIASDDDPYVPSSCNDYLKEKLQAHLSIISNGKHLNEKSGHFDLPVVLEKIEAIAKAIKD